jgi:tetratricopeptide (TPR) repeat protein
MNKILFYWFVLYILMNIITKYNLNSQEIQPQDQLYEEALKYEKEKKWDKALELYKRYLAIASNPLEQLRGKTSLAYVYAYKGEYSQALMILDDIITEYAPEKYPHTNFAADAQFSKAIIFQNIIKDYEKAIDEYQKMIEKYPNDWRVKESPICLYKIGACYRQLKNYDKAIIIYQKIINDFPSTDWEKASRLNIELIEEYSKKGIEIFPEIIKQKVKEKGIK